MTKSKPQIVNVASAAEMLGCSRQNVLYLLANKRLSGWRFNGKCWAVKVDSIKEYKAESSRGRHDGV